MQRSQHGGGGSRGARLLSEPVDALCHGRKGPKIPFHSSMPRFQSPAATTSIIRPGLGIFNGQTQFRACEVRRIEKIFVQTLRVSLSRLPEELKRSKMHVKPCQALSEMTETHSRRCSNSVPIVPFRWFPVLNPKSLFLEPQNPEPSVRRLVLAATH